MGQVSGRQTLGAAALDQGEQGLNFLRQQTCVEKGVEFFQRKFQCVQQQISGFVIGIAAAVAEEKTFGIEAGDCVAQ